MAIAKRIIALGAISALALTLSGCGGNAGKDAGGESSQDTKAAAGSIDVGISMPQKTSQNWVEAEQYFNELCKEKNLKCLVQFTGTGQVSEQQNQIDAMIAKGPKVLVIGALDGSSLGTQLAKATEVGISVIAYDRLLMNTLDLNYYVAYDNFGVGQKQGEALLEGLEKSKPGVKPYTIEVVAGSNDDSNSAKFFEGAMSVLQPKIDDGTLVIGSGQNTQAQAATQGWDPKNAQTRMDAILAQNYPGDKAPDGILSPNDTLGRAVLTSCEQAGKPQPVVTGQDSEDESLRWIMQGKQYSTISKPTKPLVTSVVDLAVKLIGGDLEQTDLNGVKVDSEQYNNGSKNVPSFLLTPVVATKDNAAEVYKDEPAKLKIVQETN
ncbi:MAG: sugar ABC transporter substrate-binding protein [Actinomycetaceae bacterium]|nr:sugar ABC transporter substrate-binding protein [Actinomycetaceae bacterium]